MIDYGLLLTEAIKLVIVIAVPTLLGYAAKYINSKISGENITKAREIATVAVTAVEQIYQQATGESLERFNARKKAAAEQRIIDIATGAGIKLTNQQIDSLIEAAVMELKEFYSSLGQ